MKPTARKPFGILALVAGLAVYALLVSLAAPLIGTWPTLAQLPVYVVLGTIWVVPLRPLLIWMETGRWTSPQ